MMVSYNGELMHWILLKMSCAQLLHPDLAKWPVDIFWEAQTFLQLATGTSSFPVFITASPLPPPFPNASC